MVVTAQDKLALARQAARLLYQNGARQVWVFGSVARGRKQDFRSDIDLAVEGLPGHLHLDMLGAMMELFPCPVDLVRMEKASPRLRENIVRFGVALPCEN